MFYMHTCCEWVSTLLVSWLVLCAQYPPFYILVLVSYTLSILSTNTSKHTFMSPLSPLLHYSLSVAPGLLHYNLLLLWEQHVYIFPAGAWLNIDNSKLLTLHNAQTHAHIRFNCFFCFNKEDDITGRHLFVSAIQNV